ncbi:MAG: xanthine dehydrogenase family protein molybdopterin-binding subunit [Endomicrobiia bacterium]|nr:xanthine dehydrogenase family protein molybdopterin-binding subunit [Endomicrobiia bacterium]
MDSIGKSFIRKDARDKVTGRAKYVDDYTRADMLFGATARSSETHAKILSVDIRAALKIPGVRGVYTHKDIPGKNIVPLVLPDYPFLAEDTVKFRGQAIALVAADTLDAARKASKLVKIKYRPIPAVYDPLESIKKNAPKIYGDDNIFRKFVVTKGDAEAAFEKCDAVVEGVYTTNYQVHAYLETQGMMAAPTDTGMVVHGSMQCPFYVLNAVSDILGYTQNRVRIIQTTTGGGFGGKEDVPSIVAGHTAMLAYITKRPVKIIYDREEDFVSMSKRHPGYAEIKYGASRDGKILAAKVRYILDGGAFSTLSPIVLWRGTIHAAGPYDIADVKVETYAVATNKVPCGAFRGFGQPQINFANESLIDELAEKLAMDPLKLRLKNALKPESLTITNQKVGPSCGLAETIEKAAAEIKWGEKRNSSAKKNNSYSKKYIRRGVGMASTIYGVCLGAGGRFLAKAGAHVQIQQDGSVTVAVGNTDMGQGARTVLSQIAAEGLGAPYALVDVIEPDTSRVPDSGPTVASRTTVMSGNAILDACKAIRSRIDPIVREMAGAEARAAVTADGGFYVVGGGAVDRDPRRGATGKKIPYAEAVKKCHAERVNLTYDGWWTEKGTTFDPMTGLGDAYIVYTFSTTAVEIEVDTLTGEVEILKIVGAHDIGRAVNPMLAQGQIQGGALQGAGYATMENLIVKNGVMLNPNFSGYTIPTSVDAPPEIIPVIVEKEFPDGPYGAKGLGEPPLISVAPAVANAIYDAVGIRIKSLPAIPEKILEAIKNSR